MITIVEFAVTGFAVFRDAPWAASVIGGGTIVGLATVFVTGRFAGRVAATDDKPNNDKKNDDPDQSD